MARDNTKELLDTIESVERIYLNFMESVMSQTTSFAKTLETLHHMKEEVKEGQDIVAFDIPYELYPEFAQKMNELDGGEFRYVKFPDTDIVAVRGDAIQDARDIVKEINKHAKNPNLVNQKDLGKVRENIKVSEAEAYLMRKSLDVSDVKYACFSNKSNDFYLSYKPEDHDKIVSIYADTRLQLANEVTDYNTRQRLAQMHSLSREFKLHHTYTIIDELDPNHQVSIKDREVEIHRGGEIKKLHLRDEDFGQLKREFERLKNPVVIEEGQNPPEKAKYKELTLTVDEKILLMASGKEHAMTYDAENHTVTLHGLSEEAAKEVEKHIEAIRNGKEYQDDRELNDKMKFEGDKDVTVDASFEEILRGCAAIEHAKDIYASLPPEDRAYSNEGGVIRDLEESVAAMQPVSDAKFTNIREEALENYNLLHEEYGANELRYEYELADRNITIEEAKGKDWTQEKIYEASLEITEHHEEKEREEEQEYSL